MRPASSCACSIRSTPRSSPSRSPCPSTPTWCGTATCRTCTPGSCTAIACTARTSRTTATGSTRTSWSSIPTRRSSAARSAGTGRCSDSGPARTTCRSTTATARRTRRSPPSSTPPSRGGTTARRRTPWHETLIYELHVKGFTQLNPYVPEALRGTYLGLASEPAIRHLTSLGVTAVELMPVHFHTDDWRPGQARAHELLGLQHARLLRPRSPLRVVELAAGGGARVQDDGPRAARRAASR